MSWANIFYGDRAFIGDADERTLAVPLSAVQQIDNQDVVFVKTGKTSYEVRPVKLGRHSRNFAEILAGIAYGDMVADTGSFILKSEALKAGLGQSNQ